MLGVIELLGVMLGVAELLGVMLGVGEGLGEAEMPDQDPGPAAEGRVSRNDGNNACIRLLPATSSSGNPS